MYAAQRGCDLHAQGDLNLNICEAHAFNTLDKFSLDVFVVNGWKGEVGKSAVLCLSANHLHMVFMIIACHSCVDGHI